MGGKFKWNLDEAEVSRLYYDLKMTMAEVAKELRVPQASLTYFMNSKNMARRPPLNTKRIGMTKKLSEFEIGWISGLVDGEGYVKLYNVWSKLRQKHYPMPWVEITNTNQELLHEIREVLGCGTVYIKKKLYGGQRKPMGSVTLTGKTAADLLKQISPYLIVKREAAIAILDYWSKKEMFLNSVQPMTRR